MTEPTPAWQAPAPDAGPAPGMAFATPGSRLVAFILDLIIQFLAIVMVGVVGAVLGSIFVLFGILAGLGILALTIGYFPYFWAKDGQTPGMNAMKIKVVRDADGGPDHGGRCHPASRRSVGGHHGLLHRRHLDLHRQAQARLAGPHRRHGRRRCPARRLRVLKAQTFDIRRPPRAAILGREARPAISQHEVRPR